MIATTIKGKHCATIADFYSITVPKIRYVDCQKPIHLISEFYEEFLIKGKRLPKPDVVVEWQKMLTWYIDQPDAVLFIRKYEGGKKDKKWDNRRGAVVRFEDGTEIAYASNFLAHDIFLMAYYGFVPSKEDFMTSAKNRALRITSGTEIEKEIRLYPSANKGLSYCYLAHIMDVNGKYLRDDGAFKKLSKTETDWIFPRGAASNWKKSADKIYSISRSLTVSERELVKAHCLRFLSPMNYYLTPLTDQCVHAIPGFTKNIGEYKYLTYYIQQQYKNTFGDKYDKLIKRALFLEQPPVGYTGREIINLQYSLQKELVIKIPAATHQENSSKKCEIAEQNISDDAVAFLGVIGDFMREKSGRAEKSVRIYLNRISKLLRNGYSVEDLCSGIDQIIDAHAKGGASYNSKDSGNTSAALGQIKKMLQYPYINYSLGYQSFATKEEHVTGYCIDGNTITISKSRGFFPLKDITKTISKEDMRKLVAILEAAKRGRFFENSDTCFYTTHGKSKSFDYSYGGKVGNDCGVLFKNAGTLSNRIQKEYTDLIEKLTK